VEKPIIERTALGKTFDDRTVEVSEKIYEDISRNEIEVSILPDSYTYSFKVRDMMVRDPRENIQKDYVISLPEGTEGMLVLRFLREPVYVTKKAEREGVKFYAYFVFFKPTGINYFEFPFLLERDGRLLIEKRIHELLISARKKKPR